MNNTPKPAKRETKSSGSTPKAKAKAKAKAGLMRMGDALANIVQLRGQLAKIPKHQQMLPEVLVAKLHVYETYFPDLIDEFEQLAELNLAKQPGGRPTKGTEFNFAYKEASAYFNKNGCDLTAENLSRIVSKKLIDDDPISYKKYVGWDTDVEDKIPRPFPRRTAQDCLMVLRACRPYE